MADRPRRVRLLLSPSHPLDAEILGWLDSLPQSGRGTELKPHFSAALIDYIRKSSARPPAPAVPPGESTLPVRSSGERRDTRALARQLLEGFGPPRR